MHNGISQKHPLSSIHILNCINMWIVFRIYFVFVRMFTHVMFVPDLFVIVLSKDDFLHVRRVSFVLFVVSTALLSDP